MSTLEQDPARRSSTAHTEFDVAVSVRPRPDDPQVYDAQLGEGWTIGAGINGGMLLATCANALRATLAPDGHPDPLSISAYYVSASRPGPAVLRTEPIRRGRSMSTGAVELSQDEHDSNDSDDDGPATTRIRALATYGDLSALPDQVATTATPPQMPPPEECIGSELAPPEFKARASLLDRLD
ncbi:MAG: thioesterase family protein, partial [Sciscionella sp.]